MYFNLFSPVCWAVVGRERERSPSLLEGSTDAYRPQGGRGREGGGGWCVSMRALSYGGGGG